MRQSLFLLCFLLLLGSSVAQEGAHSEDHEHAAGARLLVSDAEATTVKVLDLATGEELASFSTPGSGGYAYASPSAQYGLVLHRDEHRVTVVHSGLDLIDHGDHQDLVQGAPHVLHTLNVGREPTHFWAHGDHIAIFNDADGTVALLSERTLGLSLDYTEIRAAGPDHGAAVVLGEATLVGYYDLGRVDVYSMDGERLRQFGGCPGLHGEATLGRVAAFGCEDGVLLVKEGAGGFTSVKLQNPPGSPQDARVGTLASHDESAVIIGNFGDGLALVNPEAETFETVPLPSRPLRFAFGADGERLVVLTADGVLHALEPETGEVVGGTRVMAPFDTESEAPYPGLAVAEEAAFVSVPSTGEVVEIHWDETPGALEVARRIAVGGAPSGVAVLALEGGVTH